MPSITLSFTGNGSPIIKVCVGVSVPRFQALKAAGIPAPNLQLGDFLIDTGASHTAIDPTLIAPLGLTQTGMIPIHTPSTGGVPVMCPQYDVALYIPSGSAQPVWTIPALPITASSFAGQGIAGLLGRDVLEKAVFIYNGTIKQFIISY